MSQTRRLAAILAADVAGYSRLIGADESGTLQRLKAIRDEMVDPAIATHHGRLVKTTGDGLLVEFNTVLDAGSGRGRGYQHRRSAQGRTAGGVSFTNVTRTASKLVDGQTIKARRGKRPAARFRLRRAER
jgi:class 3 adenylate cyclase